MRIVSYSIFPLTRLRWRTLYYLNEWQICCLAGLKACRGYLKTTRSYFPMLNRTSSTSKNEMGGAKCILSKMPNYSTSPRSQKWKNMDTVIFRRNKRPIESHPLNPSGVCWCAFTNERVELAVLAPHIPNPDPHITLYGSE